jgi:hypothetical protein
MGSSHNSAHAGLLENYRDYLLDVICDGDLGLFDYLIRFLAHALQHPEEKPGIMIVLIGAEGVG